MIVKCTQTKMGRPFEPLVLFKPEGQQHDLDDDYYVCGLGYYSNDASTVRFDLQATKLYEVNSVLMYEGRTMFLVIGEESLTPQWFPCELFEIVDTRVPYNWRCNSFVSQDRIGLVLGYQDLAMNYSHLIGLMLATPRDIEMFLRARKSFEYFD